MPPGTIEVRPDGTVRMNGDTLVVQPDGRVAIQVDLGVSGGLAPPAAASSACPDDREGRCPEAQPEAWDAR